MRTPVAPSLPTARGPLVAGPLAGWMLGSTLALLGANWILAVGRFQADVLYWDQWGFFTPIMEGAGWWGIFDRQHGPHRQGLAFLLTSWLMDGCAWDQRINSLWISSVLFAAALGALWLKRRLAGPLQVRDVWIVAALLTLGQCDTVITTPNASHSVFPLLLILVLAHLWLSQGPAWRYLGSGLCTVFLIFTGFGIFAAAVSSILLGVAALAELRGRRWKAGFLALAALLFIGVGWAGFRHHYVFDPASPGFRFPWTPWTDYPRFGLLMLTAPCGWEHETALHTGAGLLCLGALALVLWQSARAFVRAPVLASADAILLLLGLSTLIYCANAAVGRVQMGVDAGLTSRYITLVTPAWLGIYLWACRTPSRRRTVIVAGLFALVLTPYLSLGKRPLRDWPGTLGASDWICRRLQTISRQKVAFVLAYRQLGDVRLAVERAKASVFPEDSLAYLEPRIAYLKAHGLTFFAHPERPFGFAPWLVPTYQAWLEAFDREGPHRWLGEEAELEFATRKAGYLNFKVVQREAALPQDAALTVDLGPGRAAVGPIAGSNGVSLPVPPGEYPVRFGSPQGAFPPGNGDPRRLSFMISEPDFTPRPAYTPWLPDGNGRSFSPAYELEIQSGFHGWEGDGSFGWTAQEMRMSVRASIDLCLNLVIAKRAAFLADGPIVVTRDGLRREVRLGPDGLRLSISLAARPRPYAITLENTTGAEVPREHGASSDDRPLALKITRLAVEPAPIAEPLDFH